jgi:FkbM family methyltransferase
VLRRLDVNCVLDVGANRGQYGRKLRRAGYTGRIVSFEPVSEVADVLEKRAAGDPDWHVLRYALGDEDRDMEIMVAGGQARMSSLLPPSDFGKSWAMKLRSDTKETITVRRLDGLFDQAVDGLADPRVYLKLDTQGYDLQAFAGAGDRIKEVAGMQSEVSVLPIYDHMPTMSEQLATYAAAGFDLTAMFPVIIDAPTLRVIEFDAVMIRPDELTR